MDSKGGISEIAPGNEDFPKMLNVRLYIELMGFIKAR
jgi:hypothetical protein